MKLRNIQRAFCDTIVDEDMGLPAYFDAIAPERLHIYRNAYRARMLECLGNIFEKTKAWVGEDAFLQAAQDHIVRNPPYSRSLDDYGIAFDETLARLFRDDPEVAELAWIEWTMHRIFCCTDEPVLDMQNLPRALADPAAWDGAMIRFAANITARRVTTNVAAIWHALQAGETPPEVALLREPLYICIWRKAFVPMFRSLAAPEYAAMVAIRNGSTFGEICEDLAEKIGAGAGAAKAGEFLSRWLNEGMIAAIETHPRD